MSSLITAVSKASRFTVKATKVVLVMKIKHKKRPIPWWLSVCWFLLAKLTAVSLLCLIVVWWHTTLSVECCHFRTVSTVKCFSYLWTFISSSPGPPFFRSKFCQIPRCNLWIPRTPNVNTVIVIISVCVCVWYRLVLSLCVSVCMIQAGVKV